MSVLYFIWNKLSIENSVGWAEPEHENENMFPNRITDLLEYIFHNINCPIQGERCWWLRDHISARGGGERSYLMTRSWSLRTDLPGPTMMMKILTTQTGGLRCCYSSFLSFFWVVVESYLFFNGSLICISSCDLIVSIRITSIGELFRTICWKGSCVFHQISVFSNPCLVRQYSYRNERQQYLFTVESS